MCCPWKKSLGRIAEQTTEFHQYSLAFDLKMLLEHVDPVDYLDWEKASHMLPAALPAAALRCFGNRGVLGSFRSTSFQGAG